MSNRDITIAISDALERLRGVLVVAIEDMTKDFKTPEGATNLEAVNFHDLNRHMARHNIVVAMNSYIKREFEGSKKSLDRVLEDMGRTIEGVPGTTTVLFKDDTFQFAKKQNVDGTSTLVVDLVTQLARLGVEKSVVDEALKNATKSKRGNVYYEVTSV